jgi:1,5-anhydro-D-fructose reductase (1,5-anhydro-D-mannitol-forming)
MLDGFAATLRGGNDFAATGQDAIHNMQALDAAIRSWRSGARELL